MAKVADCSSNPFVAPCGILAGHADDPGLDENEQLVRYLVYRLWSMGGSSVEKTRVTRDHVGVDLFADRSQGGWEDDEQ